MDWLIANTNPKTLAEAEAYYTREAQKAQLIAGGMDAETAHTAAWGK